MLSNENFPWWIRSFFWELFRNSQFGRKIIKKSFEWVSPRESMKFPIKKIQQKYLDNIIKVSFTSTRCLVVSNLTNDKEEAFIPIYSSLSKCFSEKSPLNTKRSFRILFAVNRTCLRTQTHHDKNAILNLIPQTKKLLSASQ
jgi:hypothetical protein